MGILFSTHLYIGNLYFLAHPHEGFGRSDVTGRLLYRLIPTCSGDNIDSVTTRRNVCPVYLERYSQRHALGQPAGTQSRLHHHGQDQLHYNGMNRLILDDSYSNNE